MLRNPKGRIAAFFDVDKTILAENSGTLYMRALWDRGELDVKTAAFNLANYLQYKLNLLDIERWTHKTLDRIKGQTESSVAREAADWFDGYVKPTIYPEATELLQKHEASGHLVAIVSGATKFVIQPLAAHLGVKHSMHTQLEMKDGRFTGRTIPPICVGEGKIYWIQQLIEREDIDLARSYFYTDSIADLPLLDLVGHPQIVNPDPLLYREARKRRWPVRFFEPPQPSN